MPEDIFGPNLGPPSSAVSGARTARVTTPLNTPITNQAAATVDYNQRTLFVCPVGGFARCRLRIANRNVLTNSSFTTPFTLTNLYYGDPNYASTGNMRPDGTFTAAPIQVAGYTSLTVPTDGSDLIGPWFAPSQLSTPGRPILLSWGLTSTNTGTGYGQANTGTGGDTQCWQITSSGSAQAGTQSPGGLAMSATTMLLDVRLEYEFYGASPVGLFIGDSITYGHSDGDIAVSSPGTLPYERWPEIAGIESGFAVANMAISGATTSTFTTSTNLAYTRCDLSTTVPDFAVIDLGTNDLGGTLTTIQSNLRTIINNLRTFGIRRIYLCTLLPKNISGQGYVTALVLNGATSFSSSVTIANGTTIQLDVGRNQETIVTSGAPTGTGPFTIPYATGLARVHTTNTPIFIGNEFQRQQLNDWMRQNPNGVSAVVDFDWLMGPPLGNYNSTPVVFGDLRLISSSDFIHPLRSGLQVMGHHFSRRILP